MMFEFNVVRKKNACLGGKLQMMSQVSRFAYADDLSHFAVLCVSKISRMNIYGFNLSFSSQDNFTSSLHGNLTLSSTSQNCNYCFDSSLSSKVLILG